MLPAGLTLNGTSGLISGTPTAAGTATFTITAQDAAGQTVHQAYSITVSSIPLTLSPSSLPGWDLNQPGYNQTVTAGGGTGPYTYSITTGALPTGLTLNSTSGLISGTPTAAGTASFTITGTDFAGETVSQGYSIAISSTALTLSPSSLPGWDLNEPGYNETVSASGGTNPYTYSVTTGALPTGLTLNSTSGLISGTPTAAGTASFTITATDFAGETVLQGYSITISSTALTLSPSSLPGWDLNEPGYSQTVSASGGTSPYNYSVTSGALPTGLTLNSTSGLISGTPTAAGTAAFTITAMDFAGETVSQGYSITISSTALTLSPSSLPGWDLNQPGYNQTVSASGGTSPYTYSVTTGVLPTGLTLNSTSGLISGTPTTSGTADFTITAQDAAGKTVQQGYSITISSTALTLGPSTLPGWDLNQLGYNQTVSASGGTSPYTYSVTDGALPAGLTLDSTSGLISGMPTAVGTASFTITATDFAGETVQQGYSITISSTVPTLGPSTLPGWDLNQPGYNQTVVASGGTSPYAYSVTTGALPTGLSLNSTTGVISGTPTATGTASFTITAQDFAGKTVEQGYTISISSTPLALSPSTLPGWDINQPGYNETVVASGGTSPYTYSVTTGALPTGLTLNSTTGVISGTPTVAGTASFTITAQDFAGETIEQSYSITISSTALTLSPSTLPGWDVNEPGYNQTIVASGGTSPYSYNITSGALPTGLQLDPTTGVISGTPTAVGAASFTITAQDFADKTVSQGYSITISSTVLMLGPPTLPGWDLNQPGYNQTVGASGGTSPYTYSVTSGALPVGLTLNSTSGQISGTPTAAGTASFTITAKDASDDAVAQGYSITISSTILTLSPSMLPGWDLNQPGYNQTVAASGGTSPYTYSVTDGALPTGLTLNSTTGVISGTPTTAGSDSFIITATDFAGETVSQGYSVTISSTPLVLSPSTLPGWDVNQPGYNETVVASGGTSPYTYSVTTGALPTGLTLNSTTGVISGTPTVAGTASFTITAKDFAGETVEQGYTISISSISLSISPNSLPGWDIDQPGYNETVVASGGTSPYTYSVTTGALPTGLSLNSTTGLISGTPTVAGTASFTITAKDFAGETVEQGYTIFDQLNLAVD